MSTAIEGLKPELVWKYFARIVRIPRGSDHEQEITKFVLQTAQRLGLKAKADEVGNVVVRKPASAGRENVRRIVLQGHLDMVCEKNKDKVHDFLKDPIEIVRKDAVLMANGTTLGADNGIAVATSLAIMEDKTLVHGPLEFLFTVAEETGLTGARNIRADMLEGRTMLNLDSEEEGALYVGCSGGRDTSGVWNLVVEPAKPKTTAAELKVSGLKGGHSGLEIDKGRGNAIKILNRVLLALFDLDVRIVFLDGGNKRNAIPREAEAKVFIPQKRLDEAAALVSRMNDTIRAELATVEPALAISLTALSGVKKGKVLKKGLQKRICSTIAALPHGVIKMSADIPGLVETSTNVAVIRTEKKAISLATSE